MRDADGSDRIGVVLGALSGKLWVHFKQSHGAVSMDFAEAHRALQPAPLSALGDLEFEGPLGTSYRFDTDALDDLFDVRSGSQHYIKLWQASVSFVGVFLDVPWVRVIRGGVPGMSALRKNCAVPLSGCKDGEVLRSLYGLCEVPSTPSGPYMESPRTKVTPRAGGSAPAFKIIEKNKKASCQAPLGVVLQVDISDPSLKVFDLRHGDRLLVLRGAGSGRMATVVGVYTGTLVVHVDGDAKVTIARGCTSAAEVAAHFARPKGSAASNRASSIPQTSPRPRKEAAELPNADGTKANANNGQQGGNRTSAAAPSPQQRRGTATKPFRCWTAFGRYEFNTSDAAVQHFGSFSHEQTLRCTQGVDAGSLFHVVGVRSGVLWVIGENKLRAVPLTHCTDKQSVERQYGFVSVGRTSLKLHDERDEEPPPTPFNSPRSRARSGSRADESPRAEQPLSAPRALPVPPIAGLQLARQLAPAMEAEMTLDSSHDEPQPSPRAEIQQQRAHVQSHPLLANSPAPVAPQAQSSAAFRGVAETIPESQPPAMMGGSGQSARNYLKAVAMFMLGTTNQNRTPLPFHEYYAVDPTRRLGAALRKLDQTRDAWGRVHPSKHFSEASVEDILRLFAKFPQLLP